MARNISAVASTLGLSTDAIRYYERIGLMPRVARTAAGYRLYDEEASERLGFIKGAQKMGLRLGDIRELLDIRDRGQCPCGHTQVLLRRRLAEVDSEIKQLGAIRRQLLELEKRSEECLESASGEWSCLIDQQRR